MMKRVAFFLVLCTTMAGVAAAREGFGFSKRAAEVTKTVPPAINIAGTKVNVTASSRSRFADKANVLKRYTEEALAANNRFQIESPGDVNVTIDLEKLDVRSRNASKVGTKSEKYKDKDGKDRYRDVPTTEYYTVLTSEIAGGYTITDRRGGELDAGDFDDSEEKEYEYVTPNERDIEESYLRTAARKIASRIAPTSVRVKVLLPRGSFESAIPLAERGNWDQYLKAVEAVPVMRDAASEAYRQYALGVGNEAVAYTIADPKSALEKMREASEHYHAAITSNPKEKLFSEGFSSLLNAAGAPLPRIEASMKAYEAWMTGPTVAKAPVAMASSRPAPPAAAMRNENVIEMAKAGVAEENIVLAIENAESTEFDTSPNGLIALSKGGVSKNVIAHIQKRAKK